MQICDESFKKVKSEDPPPLWISEEYKKVDLEKTLVDYLSRLVSHTLLHELVHAVSAKDEELAVQDLPDLDKAYGWDNIYAQDAGIATKNADNYAFLGLWAILGDMGYTLPRLNQKGVPEDEEEVRKENEEEGVMYKLADITKRTLAASVAVTFSA
jgi:hypothetical protein